MPKNHENITKAEASLDGFDIDKPKQNIVDVGESRVIYKLDSALDHAIIYNPQDDKWHLFGIHGDQTEFIHLTASSLTQEGWELQDSFAYKGMKIWAPHIIYHDDLFYMFYTGIGEPREILYVISKDLYNWESPTADPIMAYANKLTANMKVKDPMVFWDAKQEQWVMYHSMLKDEEHWVLGFSTSKNLVNWTGPEICFDEHTESPGVESPFVVRRDKYYYLVLSARPWPYGALEIFRSESPYKWDVQRRVARIDPWHAGRLVRDFDGQWYLSRSSSTPHNGIENFRIAPIYWQDNLDDEDSSLEIPKRRSA